MGTLKKPDSPAVENVFEKQWTIYTECYLDNKLSYQLDYCFTKLALLLTTALLTDLLLSFDIMLIYSYIYFS